jgi:hypothetical protein
LGGGGREIYEIIQGGGQAGELWGPVVSVFPYSAVPEVATGNPASTDGLCPFFSGGPNQLFLYNFMSSTVLSISKLRLFFLNYWPFVL